MAYGRRPVTGGFRDALHVGGSEHHSSSTRVSKRFAEPLAPGTSSIAATSSHAATRSFDADATETGVPAAKRLRSDHEQPIDNALFDPSLASGLLDQIKSLLKLVTRAAEQDGKLYTTPPPTATRRPAARRWRTTNRAAVAAPTSRWAAWRWMKGCRCDACLPHRSGGQAKGKGAPTQLSQEIVRQATQLRATFAKLEEAAKQLPGGMDMGLREQERLLRVLEGFIARQGGLAQEGEGSGWVWWEGEEGGFDEFQARRGGVDEFPPGSAADGSVEERYQASTSNAGTQSNGAGKVDKGAEGKGKEEDDTSNLAFVSPLVDGRLVDIARQKA